MCLVYCTGLIIVVDIVSGKGCDKTSRDILLCIGERSKMNVTRAGVGIRTRDIQLGKLTFYH